MSTLKNTNCLKFIFLFLLPLAAVNFSHAQYTGGSNDGFSSSSVSNQNPLPSIYLGGSNDGFSLSSIANQNPLPSIYLGGSNDGFSFSSITNQNPLLTNQNPGCTGDTVIWNGSMGFSRDLTGNWDCGVLPGINSAVITPSGKPGYQLYFLLTK